MTALALKVSEYAELLAQTLPSVIHSEEQNEHFIGILEELEHRSAHWSEGEAKLAELLTLLIEDFEDRNYQLKAATPVEVLSELMESNDLKQKDLVDVFGAESTVSAVMNGKRDMTREHIKRLSARFNVSPAVFF
ncbi:MAG: putative transcription regulator with domain [Candidatus Angelobacter sp.]|jgi:HTH-type transcriptional regulator/antitoxin HigA|nr:putative transcription regulator with domain [Candidatus Angelobacter sp.]